MADSANTPQPAEAPAPDHTTGQSRARHIGKDGSCLGPADQAVSPPREHHPPPTKTVECNVMLYCDGEGARRYIYMPKGTMMTANKLFVAERWDDLAKFPAWNNQIRDDWEADEEKYAYLRDLWSDDGQES